MSDETDPDSKELDALLREDAIRNGTANSRLAPETNSLLDGPLLDGPLSPPNDQSPIQRLLARSAHISSNLHQAFTSIRDTQHLIDLDRDSCAQLSAEMDNWQQVILDLDKACDNLLVPGANIAGQNDRPMAPASNEHEGQEAALKAKIAAQDDKIRDLEAELSRITASLGQHPTQTHADGENAEQPVTPEEDIATDRSVNRLIIAITEQGNLKFPLHKQIITIGRSPQNDIHIRSRFISRYHARIVCDADGAVIEDLNSSNGITVNSNRAKRQPLRSGDLIDLGRTQLRYIDLSEGSPGEGRA